MKVFKKNELSLLIKPVEIRQTTYLAMGVLVFFDLGNPAEPLTEQDLWKCVPDELGQGAVLDQCMPKPNAEVVITGKCFAPRGEKRAAARVSFRVGGIEKGLAVFGDRYWKQLGGTAYRITDPRPFSEMPIGYENAFGGDGFELNPVGKGMRPVATPGGNLLLPLPNIENERHLMGSPGDRPEPAGFGPLDVMWPQRARKVGTYGDKWLRERWPNFPDDMDYTFFNVAPEDQQTGRYFAGDEVIEISNMHPDLPLVRSRLPGLRVRCFVLKDKNFRPFRSGREHPVEEIFEEVKTRIDTVWLFPHILRGVVIYRGMSEILDDEYADMIRIHLDWERLQEEPKTIEHYYELQKKAADLTIPYDYAPFKAGRKQVADAMKKIKNIPKELERAKQVAVGKAPVLPRTPAELGDKAQAMIRDHLKLLDTLEKQSREMHASWGHIVEFDLGRFDSLRTTLAQESQRISKAVSTLEQTSGNLEKMKSEAHKNAAAVIRRKAASFDPEKLGIDPDDPFKKDEIKNPWHESGFPIVVECRKKLEKDEKTLSELHAMGFEDQTIRNGWLGINTGDREEDPARWGLEPEKDPEGRAMPLIVPAGLVRPRFDEARLNRIIVRTGGCTERSGDILVKGSSETPLALFALEEAAPVIRVSDELQALLVEQEAGDACTVVAMGQADEKIDERTAKAVGEAPVFLIGLPEKKHPESMKQWQVWEKAYPNAKPLHLPEGCETVLTFRENGHDLRKWIMDALPPDIAEKHRIEPALEPGKPPKEGFLPPFPEMGIPGLIKRFREDVMAAVKPRQDQAAALKKSLEGQARELISKAGLDPDKVMAEALQRPKESYTQKGQRIAEHLAGRRDILKRTGRLTPEIDEKIEAARQKALQLGTRSEERYQKGMARLEAARKELAEKKAKLEAFEPPDKLKEAFRSMGIDPGKVRKFSREEVVELHGRGESFAGAILSGLDLSKLDLRGIDLSRAQCQKTSFCGSNLDGAVFFQTMAMEADFTGATLRSAKIDQGIFQKAKLVDANAAGADVRKAVLIEADLAGIDLTGARLDWSILQKAKLNKARLCGVRSEMSLFSLADASGADFTGAVLNKCMFQQTQMDGAKFIEGRINSTMFYEVRGSGVSFAGSNMDKARMGGSSSFPGADFRNVAMKQGCFRESDLSGCSFVGSKLESCMFEGCNLKESSFYMVPARSCRFNKSNLENADMRGVNLFMGSLRKARLVGTDLRATNLYAVDFYKAVLGNTLLAQANLKMTFLHKRTDLIEGVDDKR